MKRYALWVLATACTACDSTPGVVSGGGDADREPDAAPACLDPALVCGADGAACAASGEGAAVTAPITVIRKEPRPAGLPDDDEVRIQPANNNLDVVLHAGRLFLAFRTAPTHFADTDVTIHVLSTADLVTYRHEGSFSRGRDLRECRFFSWKGRLWLHFTELGTTLIEFAPGKSLRTEWTGPGTFTEPAPFYEPTFIPWRFKIYDGKPYLIGYTGGEAVYDRSGNPIKVHLLTTETGETWTPVASAGPVVLTGGNSETDFAFTPDGVLTAVARNEAGDDGGFGSRVCTATKAAGYGAWTCNTDPKKYDSPLVFAHKGTIYLIGRRTLEADGSSANFDLPGPEGESYGDKFQRIQLVNWAKRKRCALWTVDPASRAVTWVRDLPSEGDTCFASTVPLCDGRYLVYDYSSPLDDDKDLPWRNSQLRPTLIHRYVLAIP